MPTDGDIERTTKRNERRDNIRTFLSILAAGFGACLLVAAILVPAYLLPQLSRQPLGQGQDNAGLTYTTAPTRGTVFDTVAYLQQQPTAQHRDDPNCQGVGAPLTCYIDTNVPLRSKTTLFGAEPANNTINTYQAGYTLWRADRNSVEDGIIASYIDRVSTNRRTAEPQGTSIVYFNSDPSNPGANDPTKPFTRRGFQYALPYGPATNANYRYFDVTALGSSPLRYVHRTTLNGVGALVYRQTIGPIDLYQTYDKALRDSKGKLSPLDRITLRSYRFPQAGSDTPLHAYYYAEHTITASATTGRILDHEENWQQFAAPDDQAARRHVQAIEDANSDSTTLTTLAAAHTHYDKKTIDALVNLERDSITRRQSAITIAAFMGIAGVVLLALGWIMLVRRQRAWDEQTRLIREG